MTVKQDSIIDKLDKIIELLEFKNTYFLEVVDNRKARAYTAEFNCICDKKGKTTAKIWCPVHDYTDAKICKD